MVQRGGGSGLDAGGKCGLVDMPRPLATAYVEADEVTYGEAISIMGCRSSSVLLLSRSEYRFGLRLKG